MESFGVRLTVITLLLAAFVMRTYGGKSSTCLTLYEHGGAPVVFESQEFLQWRHSDGDHTRSLEDRIPCALDFRIPFPGNGGGMRRLELELLMFFMVL
ncbi:hypothetical protein ACFX2J_044004 [Malus domestica]